MFMEDMWGQRAVRTEQWKLLDNRITKNQRGSGKYKEAELFDVTTDPMEVIDLAEANPVVVKQLRGELDGWIESHLTGDRSDPAIYDDLEFISAETKTYSEKIGRLLDSFGRK
jgi:arylsulfatase A-like enzyme